MSDHWISVTQGLPIDGRLCVVAYSFENKHHGFKLDHYSELDNCPGKWKWGIELGTQPIKVTHWFSIPIFDARDLS